MKKFSIPYNDLNQLPDVAEAVLNQAPPGYRIFAFYGEMGAGKTTLIKELCRHLSSDDNFSSPTYSIVNEYLTETGRKIYHIDLYRLNDLEEAISLGIQEYLDSGNYVFIEWPELIAVLLPPETVKVDMEVRENMRELSIFIG